MYTHLIVSIRNELFCHFTFLKSKEKSSSEKKTKNEYYYLCTFAHKMQYLVWSDQTLNFVGNVVVYYNWEKLYNNYSLLLCCIVHTLHTTLLLLLLLLYLDIFCMYVNKCCFEMQYFHHFERNLHHFMAEFTCLLDRSIMA